MFWSRAQWWTDRGPRFAPLFGWAGFGWAGTRAGRHPGPAREHRQYVVTVKVMAAGKPIAPPGRRLLQMIP